MGHRLTRRTRERFFPFRDGSARNCNIPISAGGGGYCEIKRVKLKILGRVRRSSGRGASENTPAEFEREREFPTNPSPSLPTSPLYPPHSSGNPKASTFIASSV